MASGFEALPPRTGGRANRRQTQNKTVSLLPQESNTDLISTTTSLSSSTTNTPQNLNEFSGNKKYNTGAEDMNKVFDDPAHTDITIPCLYDVENVSSTSTHSYEYLDHTADVLFHTWGKSFIEAFSYAALAFWAHLVDPTTIRIIPPINVVINNDSTTNSSVHSSTSSSTSSDNSLSSANDTDLSTVTVRTIQAKGKDLLDLLFNFLDGCLYAYGSDYFLGGRIRIIEFHAPGIPYDDIYGNNHTTTEIGSEISNDAKSTNGMMQITAQW